MTDLLKDAATILETKYAKNLESGEAIKLETTSEGGKLSLKAFAGTTNRAHEFEIATNLEKLADEQDLTLLLLDFLDGVLQEFFRHDRRASLGLDFVKRRFNQTDIWARQEYHDFEAERLADALLLSADSKKDPNFD